MSGPKSPSSSNNYAAPNSPIASSKRMEIKSPSVKPSSVKAAPTTTVRKTSADHTVAPALFSPQLTKGDEKEAEEELNDEEEEEEEEEEEAFNPYLFIAGLPPHHSVVIRDKICLPPVKGTTGRPTLALDLDETLVHCTVEPIEKPDLTFPVTFNGTFYQVYVRKRPYLDHFLETVSKSFEVVVFTASQKVYADVLLDLLDPGRKYIEHRLFREACLFVQGNYLKDLTVLGRDMTKSVLVDNSPHAYGYDLDNGIPIQSWFDDETDTELLKLIGFLKNVVDASDVRSVVRDHFKSYELVKNATLGHPAVTTSPPF